MARTLGTRYPILQGPMTRVSDVSDFFLRVAEGGALPFAALALLTGEQTEKLLIQTRDLLATIGEPLAAQGVQIGVLMGTGYPSRSR